MDPCKVCGGTDLNLVDGFYYCVECGTQDVNIQETIVEYTQIDEGVFAHTTQKKITTVVKKGIEMSGEWQKWHIFNFILFGLTEELIALGAKPSVKMKVLWVWTRYIKMYQVKEDYEPKSKLNINDSDDDSKVKGCDKEDSDSDDQYKVLKRLYDMKFITQATLVTILYVALNLDRSDIQLSHLLRFIAEGRLSVNQFRKFIPKELNLRSVKNWQRFVRLPRIWSYLTIRQWAMKFFKKLKLGVPCVPNLRKLVKNYVRELCLPPEIGNLVLSLMHHMPIDFLDVDAKAQKNLVRIPDYEGVCMGYILIAMKMCFGLDGDYEVRLSREVDKINDEENYLRSYKLNVFSEPSDRIFSFKDWCEHIQFRRLMLSKYYLPMCNQYNARPDDYVFLNHVEPRNQREKKVSDNVTMDILHKIETDDEPQVIPKSKFPATMTPMNSYVDVIAQYVQDPELKLQLCEDFTQYNLKYAIEDFKLPNYTNSSENLIVGVSESGKVFNDYVEGTLIMNEGDSSIVYVRNCQNKNWLKTKPPTVDHISKTSQDENSSDKGSDHGYDSNVENSNPEAETTHISIDDSISPEDKKLETIEELNADKSIFDDTLVTSLSMPNQSHATIKEEGPNDFEFDTQSNISVQDSKIEQFHNIETNSCSELSVQFNPNTFNRETMIEELIKLAREKYKIAAPKENAAREPRKRKTNITSDCVPTEPKKKRTYTKPGAAKNEMNSLVSAYYRNLQNDLLNQLSEQVQSAVQNEHNNTVEDALEAAENESIYSDAQHELNNSIFTSFIEDQQGDTEDANQEDNTTQQSSEGANLDNVTVDENVEECQDEFLKSDPNFDEKDHDIKQLYVKVDENSNTADAIWDELEKDPEIDKMILKSMKEYSRKDKCGLEKDNIADIEETTNEFNDSDDDIPLSEIKESIKESMSIELEKKRRKKEKLEPLLRNPSKVKEFNYWIRRYRGRCVIQAKEMTKKFDLELQENFSKSFILVISECAAIIGCSNFTIYRHMQNIEDILINSYGDNSYDDSSS